MITGSVIWNDVAPAGSWDPPTEPIPDPGELAREMEARLEAEEAASEGDAAETATNGPDAEADVTMSEPGPESTEPLEAPATRPGGAAEGA